MSGFTAMHMRQAGKNVKYKLNARRYGIGALKG